MAYPPRRELAGVGVSAEVRAELQRRTARWVLAAAAFAVSFALLASGIRVSGDADLPPFDPDEAAKLSDAYFYHLLLVQGGTRDPAWSAEFYSRTTPTVGKLVFGAVLASAGEDVGDLSLQRSFDALWRDPAALRARVPNAWLLIGRLASAFCGALACAALALAAAGLGGVAAGAAACALLLGHATFAQVSRLALTDALLLLWLAAAPLVFSPALRALSDAWNGPMDARRALLLGSLSVLAPALLVALAAGTKQSGALAGIAYGAALLAFAASSPPRAGVLRRIAEALAVGGLTAGLALVLFVASNPYLHEQPLAKLVEGIAVWRDWMVKQQLDPGGALYGTGQKVALAVHMTLRSRELPLVRALGSAGIWVGLALFGSGIAALANRIVSRRADPAALIVAAWALALAVGIALWVPVVRSKHLLPAYLPVCLLQGLGAAAWLRLPARARFPGSARSAVASGRGATAVAVGLGAALLLAPGSPLVDASLLHPILVPDSFRGARLAGYRSGVEARPDSAVRRYHLAIAEGLRGRSADGGRELEPALAGRQADGGGTSAQVLRADLLLGLALFREANGEGDAAAQARADHLALLEHLRDGMRSRDPFVRAEFDLVIERRRGDAKPATAGDASAAGARSEPQPGEAQRQAPKARSASEAD